MKTSTTIDLSGLTNPKIRLLLVEDHELIRMGISGLLQGHSNIEIVGETGYFSLALELAAQYLPDLIVLDLHLEDGPVQDRISELLDLAPSSRILVLTANIDETTHIKIIQSGAAGLMLKSQCAMDLIRAIYKVAAGELWFNRKLTEVMINDLRIRQSNPESVLKETLTVRQLSIAQLAAQGLSAKRIGQTLDISDKTVRNQLVLIYAKLGISNQIELIVQAQKLGLIQL